MNVDLSIISLVVNASPIVKLVMALLLAASIASWTIIIEKGRMLKQSGAAADEFESRFWSGGDLATMYRDIARSSNTRPIFNVADHYSRVGVSAFEVVKPTLDEFWPLHLLGALLKFRCQIRQQRSNSPLVGFPAALRFGTSVAVERVSVPDDALGNGPTTTETKVTLTGQRAC